ncbi:hypothetical protein V8C86DRAFT_2449554 [Haematococcus lacustris]
MNKRAAEEPAGLLPTKYQRDNGLAHDGGPRAFKRGNSRYPSVTYRDDMPLNLGDLWRGAGDTSDDVIVEVVMSPDYLSRENKRVKSRQIWGDLVYTPDSDLVAVLMHMGYYAPHLAHPPSAVIEVRVLIKLVDARAISSYPSKARFLKSRAWGKTEAAFAYQVHKVWLLTRTAVAVELHPCIHDLPASQPTVQPQCSERQVTTRNTGAKASKQNQEVSVQYNLCNEPWLKYTLAAVADKGLKPAQWTSARLVDHVMMLETSSKRYQIARVVMPSNSAAEGSKDAYSLSLCKVVLPSGMMRKPKLPLTGDLVEVMHSQLDWEEFQWGISSLVVRGGEILVKRINFLPCLRAEDTASAAAQH